MNDPTTAYARAVVSGEITAGKFVRLACERHLRDLELAEARGYFWRPGDPENPEPGTAAHAIGFFHHLKHYKGKWAGEPIVLSSWQTFIVGSLFGWRRADGKRRFRLSYTEVARKNGKSTLAGGIGLYMMVADGEEGAEVYSAATKKDQARIVFDSAKAMVLKSPILRKRVGCFKNSLAFLETFSKFEPLGADEDSLDGLNVHCALVDELHAHPKRGLWDVLETATGAREQPLMFAITTAGFTRGVCYEVRGYVLRILEELLPSDEATDATFGFIATIDEGDDWKDPAVWPKANPGLCDPADPYPLDLGPAAQKAANLPAAQNNFLCKRLNVWTSQATRWLPMDAWDNCGDEVDPEALKGRLCFVGLDLSSTTDITARVNLFPPTPEDPKWRVLPNFYCPENKVRLVSQGYTVDRVPYDLWQKQGLLTVTPGNVVDYRLVKRDILADAKIYPVREIAFDPWNATQLALELEQEGFVMAEIRQGVKTLSEPCKKFEGIVLDGLLAHGANDVLRWMAGNVAVRMDSNENFAPVKNESTGRIDGIVATINALARAIVYLDDPSVYEERGIISI